MMKIMKPQQGISAIGFLFVVFTIILIGSLAIKIIPTYIDNITLSSVLESVAEEHKGQKVVLADIRASLRKKMSMNNISSVAAENITLEKNDGKTNILITYEVKKPLFTNISIVMHFEEMQEVLP